MSSRLRILKEVRGVDPGWVEIIPLNLVTVQVLTWLLSAQTETTTEDGTMKKKKGEIIIDLSDTDQQNQPEMRCFSDSMILVTGLRWTEKVWKS